MLFSTTSFVRRGLLASAVAALALTAAVAQAGEVKNLMKEMKKDMKAAMESRSMDDFAANFEKLHAAAKKASEQKWSDNQAVFDEGQQKLLKQFDVVATQVSANNLEGARAELAKTDPVRKEYHKKLD